MTLRGGMTAVANLVPLILRGTLGTVRHHLKRKRLPEFSGLKAIVRLALECEHETTGAWCDVCGAIREENRWVLPHTAQFAHKWAGERRGKWIRRAV